MARPVAQPTFAYEREAALAGLLIVRRKSPSNVALSHKVPAYSPLDVRRREWPHWARTGYPALALRSQRASFVTTKNPIS
jgi:hypothetical protein